MLGCVVNGESVPDFATQFFAVQVGERFARVAAEIVHYQVDRLGSRILAGQFRQDLGEFESRPVRRDERKVPARLRLYGVFPVRMRDGWEAALIG